MLNTLFPYKYHLQMLQLEGYQIGRFINWLRLNYTKRQTASKSKLVWTFKAKFLFSSALFYVVVLNIALIVKLKYPGLLIGILFSTQPYLFLILGLLTLKPYEILNRFRVKNMTRAKIVSLKQSRLKVIGIAGSYGKTSVKEFLYQILRTKYNVLRTPESYNTVFGVWKVVDFELDESYDFFICEMGAYKIGEIKEICEMVLPDHAILTGINEQHLDRFKRIENTIAAKFELVDCCSKDGIVLVNGNSRYVKESYVKHRTDCILYGTPENDCRLEDIHTDQTGSKFTLRLANETFRLHTNILGRSNLENILAAASMAHLLGMNFNTIVSAIEQLQPVPHRLELKTWPNGLRVIDDAYSSNVSGFKAALELLKSVQAQWRIIATPGIVELGSKTTDIHKELGGLADGICDQIFLIGRNAGTVSLSEGVANTNKVTFLNSLSELPRYVANIQGTVVLVENDLPDNY
ncbi:UDP-N-acetylmuramoyl-tripeptide--D-alanyl-D-alanine ligase [Patescibacteria group bacterium]|nr:UDP-N-acetylmuramoyl-tripeptide--D-alanyl-D-alanine ligase [Patescibacteria group bacterium]MBU1970483.1 UDP-N-acetylmuramoyl-tripeptide--D-alanyl-D-alanine ligase [Patescibacteria group bacterium]